MRKNSRMGLKICAGILAVVLLGAYLMVPLVAAEPKAVMNGQPQPQLWKYQNTVKYPTKELVLTVTAGSAAEATAAVAVVPAFVNRKKIVALMFDDGSESRSVAIPHDTKAVSSFGADAAAATNKIATTYWSKAEIIVVTDGYEHALWAVPVAAFLQAPIIVAPSSSTLTALSAKFAIVVGGGTATGVADTLALSTKEAVWTFQLELFDTKGATCDYIVVTNPADLGATVWKDASLPSAILAAYRHAIVLTGDHALDSAKVNKIAAGKAREDATYSDIKPGMEALRTDIRNAALQLKSLGHSPKFMALVGGPYELPNYYIDVHEFWHVSGNTYGDHYSCSVTPYANLTPPANWNGTTYLKEDLATGRIVGHSVLDSTLMLTRTMFYREFLTGGKYAGLAPNGWENKAAVLNAHNISQPESLQYIGSYIPGEGKEYYPSLEWKTDLAAANFATTGLWLKNITTDKSDPTANVNTIWDTFSKSSISTEVGHGDPDSTWLEAGRPSCSWPGWKAVISFNYSSGNFHLVIRNASVNPTVIIYNKDIPASASTFAPSIFVMISCYTGEISDKGSADETQVISSGFTHAGTVAFIGPTEYQTKCFWKNCPEGTGSMQGKLTVEKISSQNIPIGTAFAQAKWEAWQYWDGKGDREDRDCHMYILYGDPALEPYKPNVPYKSDAAFDATVEYSDITADSDFSVKVTVNDLATGSAVSGATVKITYNGKDYTSADATVKAPGSEGSYPMKITISKTGYPTTAFKYNTQVEKGTGGGMDLTLVLLLVAVFIIIAIVAGFVMRKKPAEKAEDDENDKEDTEKGEGEEEKKGPKVLGED